MTTYIPHSSLASCMEIQDSLGLWTPRRFDSGFFVSGTWIPDFHLQWGSEILELYSGFQIPGFQISIFNGVPNSLSGIPDFKSQGSGVHKQKFPGVGGANSPCYFYSMKPVYLNLTLYVCIPSFMSILFTTHNLHGTILLLRCTQGYQKQLTEA